MENKKVDLLILIVAILAAIMWQVIYARIQLSWLLVLLLSVLLFLLFMLRAKWGLCLLAVSTPLAYEVQLASFGGQNITANTDDLFIFLLLISWLAKLISDKKTRIINTPLRVPLLVATGVGVISLIMAYLNLTFNQFLVSALHLLKIMEYGLVFVLVVSLVETKAEIKMYLKLMIGIGIFLAFIGIHQHIFNLVYNPKAWKGMVTLGFDPAGNHNIAGAYFLIFLGLLASLFFGTKGGWSKTWYGFLFILFLYPFMYTLSRSSYFAFVITILVLAVIRYRGLFAVAILGLLLVPVILPKTVWERALSSFANIFSGGDFASNSVGVRPQLWLASLNIWLSKPLLGYGFYATRYISPLFFGTYNMGVPESMYFSLLIETGLLGLGAFAWLLIIVIRTVWQAARNSTDTFIKGCGIGLVGVLCGLCVHAVFGETFYQWRLMGVLWFMIGLFTKYLLLDRESREAGL
ncbi:MAG: O-antigen ligase family protein [bacterium]|nr:O-antigen ligase family protein [bacterium]MDD5755714.1 O-antigen ligase family protein [bacterium]